MAGFDFRELSAPSLNLQGMALSQRALQDGIGNILAGINAVGDGQRKQNTNNLLASIAAANSPDAAAALRPDIANQVNVMGGGVDGVGVLNALNQRALALQQQDRDTTTYNQGQQDRSDTINSNRAITTSRETGLPVDSTGIQNTGLLNQYGLQTDENTFNRTLAMRKQDEEERNNRANNTIGQTNAESSRINANNGTTQTALEGAKLIANGGGALTTVNPDGSLTTSSSNAVASVLPSLLGGSGSTAPSGSLSNVRGIRNNNPSNLAFANQQGATLEKGPNAEFASFKTPEAGLNALSKQLDLHYSGKSTVAKSRNGGKPINTVAGIVSAWVDPKRDDVQSYISSVSKQLGVNPNTPIDVSNPNVKTPLMKAIVTVENGGNPYTDAQYAAGINGGRSVKGSNLSNVSAPATAGSTNNSSNKFNSIFTKNGIDVSGTSDTKINQAAKLAYNADRDATAAKGALSNIVPKSTAQQKQEFAQYLVDKGMQPSPDSIFPSFTSAANRNYISVYKTDAYKNANYAQKRAMLDAVSKTGDSYSPTQAQGIANQALQDFNRNQLTTDYTNKYKPFIDAGRNLVRQQAAAGNTVSLAHALYVLDPKNYAEYITDVNKAKQANAPKPKSNTSTRTTPKINPQVFAQNPFG